MLRQEGICKKLIQGGMMIKKYKVWTCKIIVPNNSTLPPGFDNPPRAAAINAIAEAGIEVLSCFSGWGGKISELQEEIMLNNSIDLEMEIGEK